MDLEKRKKLARALELVAFFVFTAAHMYILSPYDVMEYATPKMFQDARLFSILSLWGICILMYGIELFFTMENCTKKQFIVRSVLGLLFGLGISLFMYFL